MDKILWSFVFRRPRLVPLYIHMTDTKTGEVQTQAGKQVYRIVDGKLAETWIGFLPSGTVWNDAPQENWASAPLSK